MHRFQNRFSTMSENKAEALWKVLINKKYDEAYYELVDMGYWSDSSIIDDFERERALYKEFFNYYNLIMDLTDKEFDELKFKGSKSFLVHRIKLQLDMELRRVEKHNYEILKEE